MMPVAISLYRVVGRLDDAVGHPDTDHIQRKVQSAVEHDVRHIPNPFKTKR